MTSDFSFEPRIEENINFEKLQERGQLSEERMFYEGFVIYESAVCNYYEQIRTHRKKRINKKWRKRYGVRSRQRRFVVKDDVIIVPPGGIEAIKRSMGEDDKE